MRVDGKPELSMAGMNVFLRPRDVEGGMRSLRVSLTGDGTFQIPNVPDGVYQIQMENLPEDFYLKSARLGNDDVLDSGINVVANQSLGFLELLVKPNGGRVRGTVLRRRQGLGRGHSTLVMMLSSPPPLPAKGKTAKISIKGDDLTSPIEITDPKILANFNVWSGRGTSSNEPRDSSSTGLRVRLQDRLRDLSGTKCPSTQSFRMSNPAKSSSTNMTLQPKGVTYISRGGPRTVLAQR